MMLGDKLHTNNNEYTLFFESRQTKFYTRVLKIYINFQRKKNFKKNSLHSFVQKQKFILAYKPLLNSLIWNLKMGETKYISYATASRTAVSGLG